MSVDSPSAPHRPRLCEQCGYDLRGLAESRCPECGTPFNPRLLPTADVPWMRRAKIGTVYGFISTFWQLTVHPLRFAKKFDGELRYAERDAERFKSVAVATIATTVGIAGISILWTEIQSPLGVKALGTVVSALLCAVCAMSLLLCTMLPEASLGIAPDPSNRERRLYSAGAALWLMSVPLAVFLDVTLRNAGVYFSFVLFWMLTLLGPLVYWTICGVMIVHVHGPTLKSAALILLGFPIRWACSALITFVVCVGVAIVIGGILAALVRPGW